MDKDKRCGKACCADEAQAVQCKRRQQWLVSDTSCSKDSRRAYSAQDNACSIPENLCNVGIIYAPVPINAVVDLCIASLIGPISWQNTSTAPRGFSHAWCERNVITSSRGRTQRIHCSVHTVPSSMTTVHTCLQPLAKQPCWQHLILCSPKFPGQPSTSARRQSYSERTPRCLTSAGYSTLACHYSRPYGNRSSETML